MSEVRDSPGARRGTLDERLGRVLESIERGLIYVVALFLIGFAVLALVDTVVNVWQPVFSGGRDITSGIVVGVDKSFLTVILLELLHTVLSRGPISRQLQEFLVIGITSGVRRSLEIAVGTNAETVVHKVCIPASRLPLHATSVCQKVTISVPAPSSRDVVIDLTINASGVLILVGALWLVRQQAGVAPEERVDGPILTAGRTPR